MKTDKSIVFYDGHCALCHFWVKQILKHDAKERFHFASLEGEMGHHFTQERSLEHLDSIIVWKKGEAYWTESEAVFTIAKSLGGYFNLFSLFRFLPRFMTDSCYRFLARNRKKWFGRHATCPPPPAEFRRRFFN